MARRGQVDIVLTVYNVAHAIAELHGKLVSLSKHIRVNYGMTTNLIFVDDYSTDDSHALLESQDYSHSFGKVSLIKLSKNYGQHLAILAGLKESTAQLVLLMDGDIDQDPLFAVGMLDKYFQNPKETDVVYAFRSENKLRGIKGLSSFLFWKLLGYGNKNRLESGQLSMRVMKRSYVQELLRYEDNKVFWGAVFQVTGFEQIGVAYTLANRGPTNYTTRSRLKLGIEALLNYSPLPYKLAFAVFGIPLLVLFIYLAVSVFHFSTLRELAPGWLTVIIILIYQTLLSSLMFLFLLYFFLSNRRGSLTTPSYHIKSRKEF